MGLSSILRMVTYDVIAHSVIIVALTVQEVG